MKNTSLARALVAGSIALSLPGTVPPAGATSSVPTMELIGNFKFGAPAYGTVKLGEFRVCVRDATGGCAVDEGGEAVYEERDFAFALGYPWAEGLKVIDVTDPAAPSRVATACIRDFIEGSLDIRPDLGLLVVEGRCPGSYTGDWISVFDISDPRVPSLLSTLRVPLSGVRVGVHGVTFHPTAPIVYISTSGGTQGEYSNPTGTLPVVDLSNPSAPRLGTPMPTFPRAPHAISFNRLGTRAYGVSTTHTDVIDTTNPMSPVVVASIFDPTNKNHDWGRPTSDGRYLVVGDGVNLEPCPGGALHIYDLTTLSDVPVKVGTFVVPDHATTIGANCANAYFDIDRTTGLAAAPWQRQGTFLLDLSNPQGLGTQVVARTDPTATANAYSATFFEGRIYVVDGDRGLDIFEIPSSALEDRAP